MDIAHLKLKRFVEESVSDKDTSAMLFMPYEIMVGFNSAHFF